MANDEYKANVLTAGILDKLPVNLHHNGIISKLSSAALTENEIESISPTDEKAKRFWQSGQQNRGADFGQGSAH